MLEAIVNFTALPIYKGMYTIEYLPDLIDISYVPHYITHPKLKLFIESYGALQAFENGDPKKFIEISYGKSILSVTFKTPFLEPNEITINDLNFTVISRFKY